MHLHLMQVVYQVIGASCSWFPCVLDIWLCAQYIPSSHQPAVSCVQHHCFSIFPILYKSSNRWIEYIRNSSGGNYH